MEPTARVPATIPAVMQAVVTVGNGGYDQLQLCEVPVPPAGAGEVLVQVLAAGLNNTDINTRVGWYADGGWSSPTPFPLIQGADCCGRVAAVGPGVREGLRGRRVLVRSCMRTAGFSSPDTRWLGSDFDGAFAQFVLVPASEVFPVESEWTDVELATIPCATATAENMVARAGVTAGDRVLVTGASGGVGSAAVQLARRRGATVVAVTTGDKATAVRALGADVVLDRHRDTVEPGCADVVIDNVGGDGFSTALAALRRRGRYVSSGAIAGPIVALDLRTMYLNDLTLFGCTAWDEPVFADVIGYVERNEIAPVVAGVYPLAEIAAAQQAFLAKVHVGNFVVIPSELTSAL